MDSAERDLSICYEAEFFRSWATRNAQTREGKQPVTKRDRLQVMPVLFASTRASKPCCVE